MKGPSYKNEIVVGLFIIFALVVFFAMTFIIRGSTGVSPYYVNTEFANVSGLEIGSPVLVQGFRVGRVIDMTAGIDKKGEATVVVTSKVARKIPIHKDASVALVQQGFIGDKRLEIDPGTKEAGEIENYDTVRSIPPTDLTVFLADAQEMVADLKATLANTRALTEDKDRIAKIDATIANIEESTARLSAIIEENRESIRDTVENVEKLSVRTLEIADKTEAKVLAIAESTEALVKEIRETRETLDKRAAKLMDKADTIGENTNILMVSTREEIKALSDKLLLATDNINDILGQVNRGQGTIGALVKDPQPFDELQESITALRSLLVQQRGEYFYDTKLGYETAPSQPPATTDGVN